MGRYMVDTREEYEGRIYPWSKYLAEGQPWMQEIWGEFVKGEFTPDRKKTPENYLPESDKPVTDMSKPELFQAADDLGVIISRKASRDLLIKKVKKAIENGKT
uniref:Uncharacterized protein n=1 Tax=viral metagenome TaxID=1070528 RepID=A0A6H1ZUL5_9ZZZZ